MARKSFFVIIARRPLYAGAVFCDNLPRWSPRIRLEDGLGARTADRVNNDYPIMFAPGQPRLNVKRTPAGAAIIPQTP